MAEGDYLVDVPSVNSPCFDTRMIDENTLLDNALFRFSNGVGAIVTYLIVQSMNPVNAIPDRDARNDEEKDINVNRWFKDGISTLGDYLLPLFKDYIGSDLIAESCNNYVNEDGTIDYGRLGMDLSNYAFSKPSFTLDEKSTYSLRPGLCNYCDT